MGKAIDKLKELRNQLVTGQQKIDQATEMGKASLLKTLKANGIKADEVLEFDLNGAGIFMMGGKKYVCQVEDDGVSYGEIKA
ncbi:hypothetical protein [Stenomitos frigidus]|uniref:Uncharacterized protein n=1 Tax=Stenomitos frigidus ULC18 TaxID=2107698 RepID=A0A2T1DUC7_9CYAN|nr:hypothetical protein [Stenomitos frigidus]PSB24095.1 hypothetical protein C7B82_28565 [Stenomitos frigidus ULC18]